jgi:hypothetical protein
LFSVSIQAKSWWRKFPDNQFGSNFGVPNSSEYADFWLEKVVRNVDAVHEVCFIQQD